MIHVPICKQFKCSKLRGNINQVPKWSCINPINDWWENPVLRRCCLSPVLREKIMGLSPFWAVPNTSSLHQPLILIQGQSFLLPLGQDAWKESCKIRLWHRSLKSLLQEDRNGLISYESDVAVLPCKGFSGPTSMDLGAACIKNMGQVIQELCISFQSDIPVASISPTSLLVGTKLALHVLAGLRTGPVAFWLSILLQIIDS